MSTSHASARWDGTLKDGRGVMKPANAGEVPFTLNTRFAGEKGSNPEEVLGSALAGCFSMALSASLGKAGITPKSIETSAKVQLDKEGDGFTISSITLTSKVSAQGIDAAKFDSIAQETKRGCPVSKALAGTKINLEASLV
ncbi:MAG: OsmC family peroxiredoxin [Polyangiales bacterium]